LPKSEEGHVIGRQLLRAGTAVAANYRAVGQARSRAEFIAKMGIVVEEIDEVVFWVDLIADGRLVPSSRLADLQKEAKELLAIFAASQHTAKIIDPRAGSSMDRWADEPTARFPDSMKYAGWQL
jgi:four helix bundle protein